jgi:cytochrome c-type biogenesis protein CcsB
VSVNETLATYSNYLVYGAMAAYAIAMIAFAASMAARRARDLVPVVVEPVTASTGGAAVAVATRTEVALGGPDDGALPPGRRSGNIGMSLMWLGTLLLGGALLLRGLAVQRAPWGNMCEFSMTSAFTVAVAFLVLSLKRDLRWLGIFVVTPVLLALGSAMTFLYTDAAQLVPALKSYWLVIHVSAAVISGGAFCVGAAVTLLFLVADSAERRARLGQPTRLRWLASRLPESARLDAMAYRIHAFMFPLWTFAIVAGAIWAENAWGRYWGWDPKETWAFITWVAYAAYLHARATVGWRGRKAAMIALVAFGCFLFNYFGVNILITGLHSYAGV